MVQINKIYKHFKGNLYKVLHVAKNSETLEDTVVYQALYDDGGIWVRPLKMFEEEFCRDGKIFKRFELVEE